MNQILDMSFIDASHGWLLASLCDGSGQCRPGVRYTADGGLTWQALPDPPAEIAWNVESGPGKGIRSILFSNTNLGWLYGPGLFATQDGGQTWKDESNMLVSPSTEAFGVETAGNSTWLVGRFRGTPGECDYQWTDIFSPLDTWHQIAIQFCTVEMDIQIVRLDPENAWVITWGNSKGNLSLLSTQNAGASWQSIGLPESLKFAVEARLSVPDPQNLWLVTAGVPGAGQQLKSVYLSIDGGKTWSEPGSLPTSGYLDELAAISPLAAFLRLGRGTLYRTLDGGKSWQEAIPLEQANPGDSSGWHIQFVDSHHGWASLQNRVFRTADGGRSWEMVEIKG